ncbi:MAG: ATP-dependent Clp protease ATP-binding subunit, partial [Clostridia bacterium]|nr:ATP-dependent Clp protease ATP-binding subunit [Clostridia bacterium]
PETLIRLDMSEFMEKHSVSKIIGAPPGYVGYDEAGQLTEKIRRRPYSVVLFDEIEKAHKDVLNILLQILDDGKITDAHGKTVNFENTLIVMTTNAGAERSAAVTGFAASEEQTSASKTMKALESFLRPEFINRVDEIITFRSLTKEDFSAISVIMLDQLAEALAERGIRFRYSASAAAYIGENSYSSRFGARNMRRFIQVNVEDPLANRIIAARDRKIADAYLDTADGSLSVTCSES